MKNVNDFIFISCLKKPKTILLLAVNSANDFRAKLRFPRVAREPPRHCVPEG
jgi:hypothetical protein